jgi:predicted DNA-binding transcriptional regulator AlpA
MELADKGVVRNEREPTRTPEGGTPASTPFAVEAKEAARLCGVSRATWYKLRKAGKVPRPVRLGRRTIWRVDELREWMDSGCPALMKWEAMKPARWKRAG